MSQISIKPRGSGGPLQVWQAQYVMHTWWIAEGLILGGSNPSTDELLSLAAEGGVRFVVSFLEEPHERPRYDLTVVASAGIERLVIPVVDMHAPTVNQMESFVSFVKDHGAGGTVFIHCQGGAGRTGTMGAAYWITEGLSARAAIERIREACPFAIESGDQEASLAAYEGWVRSG